MVKFTIDLFSMNFSFLLKLGLKMVPEPVFSVFSILRGRVNAWVDDI